ncbi:MAG: hypothetical protein NCW75_11395 [Phycisphaera sp.]|nr:MAG: hypothetical protein NCW75_11395 [Phycisphaera sp.]
MKSFLTCASIACCTLAAAPALAQHNEGGSHAKAEQKTANAMCPIGKEPIVASAGTVEYKGHAIGTCCPGCGEAFLKWDEQRKDEFVALAVAHREPGMDQSKMDQHGNQDKAADEKPWTGPYALDTCPVSGGKLGSMGDPIVKTYDGREVRFCCAGCIGKFEADKAGYWQKIDEQMIAAQMPYYPTEVCLVSGEPLVEDGEDIANNVIYGNRLVRLCCKMCEKEFKADPTKYIAKLDEAAADAQRKDYAMDTCAVAGGKLGSMGEPVEMVVAGRLIRLCCGGCKPKIEADPAKYVMMIDKAWQAEGKFMPKAKEGEHAGDHGDHNHGG